eukprot:7787917-Ditylum_brightwellii.AAC.1
MSRDNNDDNNFIARPLPSASAVTSQVRQVRNLTKQWECLFDHVHGYLLDHDYTQANLHFADLKGRDKEVVSFLQDVCDEDGTPMFVVCLTLIQRHQIGEPEGCGYNKYSGRSRGLYNDSDGGDHVMGEIHDTTINTSHWIGPDDRLMDN